MRQIIQKNVKIINDLTNTATRIKTTIDQNSLSDSQYQFLNNKLAELSALIDKKDLVELGILQKPISEFTNDDIGTIISIPYTDESGKISLNDGCIEFQVVGVNHHKDIKNESKPTITLMPTVLIINAAFDAIETNGHSNNRWMVSNIRQWLNSEGAANSWFTPQHEYDTQPICENLYDYEFNQLRQGEYANLPGFLAGFSSDIKQHLATVRNKTVIQIQLRNELNRYYDETNDKVFLLSRTEMGFSDMIEGYPEGNHLSYKFINDESRIKQLPVAIQSRIPFPVDPNPGDSYQPPQIQPTVQYQYYYTRSIYEDTKHLLSCVDPGGTQSCVKADHYDMYIAPVIVLY